MGIRAMAGPILGSLFCVALAGGPGYAGTRDWKLIPLLARPEDQDSTNIQDQNDLMASPSPDGKRVLFTSRRSGAFRQYVMNTDGSDQHVISSGPGWQMQGSWSPDGARIAYLQRSGRVRQLAVMDTDGSEPKILAKVASWTIPSWSPDGRRILYHAIGESGSDDIWSIDVDGGEPEFVLGSESADQHAAWSPDGSRIVFTSRRDGKDHEVYTTGLHGGPWVQLTNNEVNDYSPSWSSDGSRIVFQSPRGGRWTIVTMNADGSAQSPVTQYPMQYDPAWSHDGSESFFNSDRDGRRGIYVMNADGSHQRKLTNTEPSPFVRIVREAGVQEASRLLRQEQADNSRAVYFYEREIQYLGQNFLEMGYLDRAALLFKLNVEAYPQSGTAHTDLGNAWLAAGETGLAVESYKKALQIDPADQQLSALLDRLESEKK